MLELDGSRKVAVGARGGAKAQHSDLGHSPLDFPAVQLKATDGELRPLLAPRHELDLAYRGVLAEEVREWLELEGDLDSRGAE